MIFKFVEVGWHQFSRRNPLVSNLDGYHSFPTFDLSQTDKFMLSLLSQDSKSFPTFAKDASAIVTLFLDGSISTIQGSNKSEDGKEKL